MALTNNKKYIDLADLNLYKELEDSAVASAISTASAMSLKTVAIEGTTLKFYREKEPVGTATPAYEISLPQTDISALETAVSTLQTNLTALDNSLAAIAKSGDAEDVEYDNTTSELEATDVQAAIDELAAQSAGGVASKAVHLKDESAGQSEYAKVYKLYQGANASDMSKNTAIGIINIPKDMVVQSGSVVKNPDGQPAGTYIRLVIQNQTDPLFINVADLVDAYTAAQNATQIQLAVSANNEISATVVAGSIGATELAASAVTTIKIADDAVTTAKILDENVTYDKLAPTVQSSLDAADSALQLSDVATEAEIRALFASSNE